MLSLAPVAQSLTDISMKASHSGVYKTATLSVAAAATAPGRQPAACADRDPTVTASDRIVCASG
jgi:hypothetical protein